MEIDSSLIEGIVFSSGKIWINVPWSDEDNSSFSYLQRLLLKSEYKFYFHSIFIICLLLFYENDSAILTEKKLFLHDFC